MANELAANCGISFAKAGVTSPTGSTTSDPIGESQPLTQFSVAGSVFSQGTMLASFEDPTPIPLGAVDEPHWTYLQNLDDTNFVTVRKSESGDDFLKLLPGEFALFPFNPDSVPHVIADTADVLVKYLIVSL